MIPFYEDGGATVYHGDCIEVMRTLPDASVDAVITDPPYGIRFMGQAWDGADIETIVQRGRDTSPMPEGVGGPRGGYRSLAAEAGRYDRGLSANQAFQVWCEDWAAECLRLLKPGGHLLTFGSSRTWHRLAAGVEDAGFEIRDSIAWLYGSGFPKSLNVLNAIDQHLIGSEDADRHSEWEGWGTALKPAFEPIVVGRKPLAGTVAANVLAHGTGALNIDATRTATTDDLNGGAYAAVGGRSESASLHAGSGMNVPGATTGKEFEQPSGRWPTNVVLDESQAAELDRQTGELSSGMMRAGTRAKSSGGVIYGKRNEFVTSGATYGDSGGASRFFPTFRYEAKAPSDERPSVDGVQHPTVKPLDLMRWLVRLVTPPEGVVLEPFAGSGTTIQAALLEGFSCIGIEREDTYLPLILQRIRKPMQQDLFGDWGGAA